jgi:hypothetical protein
MQAQHNDPQYTKLTVRSYEPIYNAFDIQISNTFLRRDAFLNTVIASD